MVNMLSDTKRTLRPATRRLLLSLAACALLIAALTVTSFASASFTVDLGSGDATADQFGVSDLLFVVLFLALAPSLLLMMTSFTRIIIVLSFTRNALGTQQSPPNQVLTGLALFLTMFIMQPVFSQINETAYQPYRTGVLTQQQAVEQAVVPIKEFMLRQTYTSDISLFLSISHREDLPPPDMDLTNDADLLNLGLEIVVPSFITSELKRAFTIGFLLFIPFLIIDIVVSSTLMSMGMVMLPPSMIALPFKIMTFVLVDGWGLLLGSLVRGFR